jgi:DNA primase
MDCISVFAAGIPNVIASSGTAFTEPQARLLGRFSRNIIVNFDPDTAGANAAERSLGLLVEEDFQIKVLTLDTGFDPDLFIRNKGREAYIAALRAAPKYFDYLIARAQSQFPVRTPEGKVKAINFLLPHVQRVHDAIARAGLANEIAQKIGIDAPVVRQRFKLAATSRSSARIVAGTETTNIMRVLMLSLCTAESESNPRGQVRTALADECLHEGMPYDSALNELLAGAGDLSDLSESSRKIVAEVLLTSAQPLSNELVLNTLTTLRMKQIDRQRAEVRRAILEAEQKKDATLLAELSDKLIKLDRRRREVELSVPTPTMR